MDLEITIKISNTPNHTFFPLGKEFSIPSKMNDTIYSLLSKMKEHINQAIQLPNFLTYSLYTKEHIKTDENKEIQTYFTTRKILDIIDRNENIFYLLFHNKIK